MLADETIKREKKTNMFKRGVAHIRGRAAHKYRDKLNHEMRRKLEGVGPFTIFSNNCLGGIIYHDAGLQFTSPLINTAMDGEDFLQFLSNPKHYLSCEMEFFSWPGRNFPIARIDDVEVNFVHYVSSEESKQKWKIRAERIAWDNIFIIATDNDGMCHEECLKKFDELPYKNKIMFVSKDYPQYDWAIQIKTFKHHFQCRGATGFADMKGHRYYETAFDIAEWIRRCSEEK